MLPPSRLAFDGFLLAPPPHCCLSLPLTKTPNCSLEYFCYGGPVEFRDDSWAKPVACIFKGPLYTLPPSKRRNY